MHTNIMTYWHTYIHACTVHSLWRVLEQRYFTTRPTSSTLLQQWLYWGLCKMLSPLRFSLSRSLFCSRMWDYEVSKNKESHSGVVALDSSSPLLPVLVLPVFELLEILRAHDYSKDDHASPAPAQFSASHSIRTHKALGVTQQLQSLVRLLWVMHKVAHNNPPTTNSTTHPHN